MKKQWMIAILAVVCVALVACVLIGPRLQADHSAPDTRTSPNEDMLTAEEMQEQIETLQKEHKALNEALELREQERTRLQEELSDAKSALEASVQEKEALKGEAEKLTSELSDAQGKIQTLNASLEKASIDQLKADNTLLQGRIDEIQTALDAANKEKDSSPVR
jgi:DNA repair exonuclease SbcCD ATPase subunit